MEPYGGAERRQRSPDASGPDLGAGDVVALQPTALSWIEKDQTPRLIVTPASKFVWANRAAGAHLRSAIGVVKKGALVSVADASMATQFQRFVADDAVSEFCAPLVSGAGHVIVRRTTLADSRLPQRPVGLTIVLALSGSRFLYSSLTQAFGLTRQEDVVLQELVNGACVKDIAEKLSLKTETVRSHVRGIYEKTRVQTREQLFCRVQPFRSQRAEP